MSAAVLGALASTVDSPEIQAMQHQAALPDVYLDDLRDHVTPLAARILEHAQSTPDPILIGINGCQGSGKSTLARFLGKMLQIGANLRCTVVSIDDFYLEKSTRRALARDVHPLLATRGVPGTHDLLLAHKTLDELLDASRTAPVAVPTFSKATDDRDPIDAWHQAAPGINVVILEGWCVGCLPEHSADLGEPLNQLEQEEDSHGVWRHYVNDALTGDYASLFQRLDALIMLAAPSFECVYEWRQQQERQLARSLSDVGEELASPLLLEAPLRRFISHFERLTRHQLRSLPDHADAVVGLNRDHRMVSHSGRWFT